jgi:hypothetical protein
MALFTFTVKPDGGDEYELEATSRDVLNWERTTKGASLSKFERDAMITDVYKISHFAAVRAQRFTGDLKEWQDSVDIEFEKDEEDAEDAVPPTKSAR